MTTKDLTIETAKELFKKGLTEDQHIRVMTDADVDREDSVRVIEFGLKYIVVEAGMYMYEVIDYALVTEIFLVDEAE